MSFIVSHRLVVSLNHLEIFQSSASLILVVFYCCYGVFNKQFSKHPFACEVQGFSYSSE